MSHPSIETLIIEIPEVPIPRLNSKMKLSQKIDEPKQELVDEPKQELPSQEIVFRLTPRRNK